MAKLVRVLFYNTSVHLRSECNDVAGVTQKCSSDVRYVIERELKLGERLAQGALSALYGDKISAMDIISAILQLRTVEGLDELNDRLVLIRDADQAQINRLVSEYRLPTGSGETTVLFLSSLIDPSFQFKLKVLRDTSKDEVLEEK